MVKNRLDGKTIVFTGALTMKRAEATAKAKEAGAKVASSVSGNTDILIAGPGAGQKIHDAQSKAAGVEIWDEAQFLAEINAGGSDAPKSASKKKAATAAPPPEPKPAGKRTAKKAAAAQEEEEDEEDEEPAAKKKTAARKAAAAPAAAKAPAKRGAAKAAKQEEESDEEPPAAATKAPAKRGAAKKAKDEEPVEETKPEPKASKKRSASTKDDGEASAAEPTPKKAAVTKQAPAKSASGNGGGGGGGGGMRRPDRCVPGGSDLKVYQDYDVKLMFTDIGTSAIGNNKFYIIQVLEGRGSFWSWNRWGRLGENGQNKLEPCPTPEAAIKLFEKKFQEKTKNKWADRAAFVRHPDKYQLVETEEEAADGDGGPSGDAALGRLSVAQIKRGQDVLQKIRSELEGGGKANLVRLSSDFYSLIPTTTGRKAPERIDNMGVLEAKEGLLEFWLRMGFDDMTEEPGATPITGVMDLPLPATLLAAASIISDPGSISSSQARGAQLLAKKAGSPTRPMDRELYAAILLYTGNSIYMQLNQALRSEDRKATKRYFSYLRLFLEAMGRMPQQVRQLWRGVSVDLFDQYAEGRVITWWGVSSCTSDEQVARNFMRSCGGPCTLLTIDCKTAMDISALSFYANEKESLLAPGTQLRVVSRTRKGLITEIRAEEVGRAFS